MKQDARFRIHDTGSRMKDAGYKIQDARYKMQDERYENIVHHGRLRSQESGARRKDC